jgi:signal transduction histidine kinase
MPREWTVQEIECLVKLSSIINSSLDIVEVLDNSMHVVENLMNAEASSIFEIDCEENELFFRVARGESGIKINQIRIKMGEGIAGWVASSGDPLIVPDTESDTRFSKKMDELSSFTTKSIVALPIHYKGRITGVLEVLNIRDPRAFSSKDLEMLTIVTDQIGIALENARLYDRLKEKFALTQNELRESQAKLIRSERLAALGQFSQGVAHAVRNPVMRIGGFARRLKKKLPKDDSAAGYADFIIEEATRLEMLVKDVWSYTSMSEPKVKRIKTSSLVEGALKDWGKDIDTEKITVETKLLPEDPVICADKELMAKAIVHILENARDAVSDGGTISVSTYWKDKWIVLSIKDTGSGITPKDLPLVYDPFFTTKTHGSGLGLTTVNRIVTGHRGEVNISSEKGSGTEVRICLPPFSNE